MNEHSSKRDTHHQNNQPDKEHAQPDQADHHDHSDDHDHDHDHDHENDHDHEHQTGLMGLLDKVFHFHGHDDHGNYIDEQVFQDNEEGIRTVWLALAALLITALIQIVIVVFSGSVALLADTAHNIGDGLNSIPLLVAFYLARRAASRRYNYGYGKAEDVAGIFIVLSIAFSAGLIFWESFKRFIDPQPIENVAWVAAAAVIGFLGNEAVALFQIRVGRKIGSAALVADGLHARTDGLTSLAVLVAAGGSWLGFPLADPIVGLLIGIAILFITRNATVTMWYRLMDAIEPEVLEQAETAVSRVEAVQEVRRVRMRWMGHRLHAEAIIAVDASMTTAESHDIVEAVRHELFHEVKGLAEVIIHVEPWSADGHKFHSATEHHEREPAPFTE